MAGYLNLGFWQMVNTLKKPPYSLPIPWGQHSAATERNPHLAGSAFQATAISLIVHPRNPHVPVSHMNLRFFYVEADEPAWYFGGGYDLTPCYRWMRMFVCGIKPPHTRWASTIKPLKPLATSTSSCRIATRPVAWAGYFLTIGPKVVSRITLASSSGLAIPSCPRTNQFSSDGCRPRLLKRNFQLYRRGRYAEFNLAIDRGTKYMGCRVAAVLSRCWRPCHRW